MTRSFSDLAVAIGISLLSSAVADKKPSNVTRDFPIRPIFRYRRLLLAGFPVFVIALSLGCAREESARAIQLNVKKATTSMEAKPIVHGVVFDTARGVPLFQIANATPEAGKMFVLFELDVTNQSSAKLTFELAKLEVRVGGQIGDSRVDPNYLYYLDRLEKSDIGEPKEKPMYISLVGVTSKKEIELGKTITWQLMAILGEKDVKKEISIHYPGADPRRVSF